MLMKLNAGKCNLFGKIFILTFSGINCSAALLRHIYMQMCYIEAMD